MRKNQFHAILALMLAGCLFAVRPVQAQTTAFVDVNVIPMDTEQVLENYTVIVRDGAIAQFGPSDQVAVPEGAQIIDGDGGYLMPGLADMHVHLTGFDANPGHLVFYLAEGTTTVRAFSGSETELAWRKQVEQGQLPGPSLIVGRTIFGNYMNGFGIAAPILLFRLAVAAVPVALAGAGMALGIVPVNLLIGAGAAALSALSWLLPFPSASPLIVNMIGQPNDVFLAESPLTAALEAQRIYKAGFDFLKVYDGLSLGQFEAALASAQSAGLYQAGHLPDQIPLDTAFSAGLQELAHVDELFSYHWMGYDPSGENDPQLMRTGFPINAESIPDTVSILRKYDIPVVANLSTDEMMYRLIFDTPGILSQPEYDVVRPAKLEFWRTSGRNVRAFKGQGPYRRDQGQPFLQAMTQALHEAGALITIGTDTSNEGCIPGNIHRELELLVESGFTPYEALEAGTKAASLVAARMGKGDRFGTIEVGKRADLLLLAHNPLEDVSHTRERVGVMAQGIWYSQNALNAMMQAYVASY